VLQNVNQTLSLHPIHWQLQTHVKKTTVEFCL